MQIQMKLVVAGALAMLAAGGASSQGRSGQNELQAIAKASGLSVPEVRMVLSDRPTAYTTWYAGYDTSARKLREAVTNGRVHLLPSDNGVYPDFATWQRLPNRALSFVPAESSDIAQADAHRGN